MARPWRVTISLDGIGEVHNQIRGREKFFEKTSASIETLKRVRKENGLDFEIRLKTVIMRQNVENVCEIARFANQDGMHVFYQPIEQNYNTSEDPTWFEHSNTWPADTEKAIAAVNRLIQLKRDGLPIANSYPQLEAMIPYFQNPEAMRIATQNHSAHENKVLCSALQSSPSLASSRRIGGAESYARSLSVQLGERGWLSVLCFLKEPPESVRRYLQLPNVRIEVIEDSWRTGWSAVTSLRRILRRYRPEILHLHFTGFIGPYPWLAKLCSIEQVFFTDHSSQPEGYVTRRAPFWKRCLARLVNLPMTRVITVSEYGYRCAAGRDLVPIRRLEMVYNSADLSRASNAPASAAEFRRKHSIPPDRTLVSQVSWIIPEKITTCRIEPELRAR